MGWAGKIIFGGIGLAIGGPLGAVIGGVIGNVFDNGGNGQLTTEEEANAVFFTTTFSMLAKFAQADGVVTRSEVYVIDNFVKNELRLDNETKDLAIKIFDEAKRSQVPFEDFANQFYNLFRNDRTLLISMVDLLMKVAMADDKFHENESRYINKVASIFKISQNELESIKARYIQSKAMGVEIDNYYKILEVSPEASTAEIKKTYRKKIKEYHPDNIIGKGLPNEFIKFAEEKFKEIQDAYEIIMEERKAV
ncbi:MAG: co-chaperone DjlA [Halanaerobiales bacterium]